MAAVPPIFATSASNAAIRPSTSTAPKPPVTNHKSNRTLPAVTKTWNAPDSFVPLTLSKVSARSTTTPDAA